MSAGWTTSHCSHLRFSPRPSCRLPLKFRWHSWFGSTINSQGRWPWRQWGISWVRAPRIFWPDQLCRTCSSERAAGPQPRWHSCDVTAQPHCCSPGFPLPVMRLSSSPAPVACASCHLPSGPFSARQFVMPSLRRSYCGSRWTRAETARECNGRRASCVIPIEREEGLSWKKT